jgi:hypothetical protein
MQTVTFDVCEFRTGRVVASTRSYGVAFGHAIHLYRASDNRTSYVVKAVTA